MTPSLPLVRRPFTIQSANTELGTERGSGPLSGVPSQLWARPPQPALGLLVTWESDEEDSPPPLRAGASVQGSALQAQQGSCTMNSGGGLGGARDAARGTPSVGVTPGSGVVGASVRRAGPGLCRVEHQSGC